MPYKDKTKRLDHQKQYHRLHRDDINRKRREYYIANKIEEVERITRCHQNRKLEVLTHYGNGKLACIKCRYDDVRALSIDHTDGNGGEHRRLARVSRMYGWLKKHNYPEGYQTLCMNCQFIKRANNRECKRKK